MTVWVLTCRGVEEHQPDDAVFSLDEQLRLQQLVLFYRRPEVMQRHGFRESFAAIAIIEVLVDS